MRRSRDSGSVLVLTLGLVVVCALAIAVVTDVTSAFLQRRALASAADGAAMAVVQRIDLDAYFDRGAAGVAIRAEGARATVIRHLRESDAFGSIKGLVVERVRVHGREVTVQLRATVRTPVSGLGSGVSRASATARLDVG